MEDVQFLFRGGLFSSKDSLLDILAVRANHNFEVARLADIVELMVVVLEILLAKFEVDGLFFASLDADFLESTEFLDGTCGSAIDIVDIELHSFETIATAGVLHFDAGCHGSSLAELVRTEGYVAIFEGGVTQTITEVI